MVQFSNISMAKTFRSHFKLPDKSLLHWFPGHMSKGLKVMQKKLRSVDCVIEVHDARIPVSGRNPNFQDRINAARSHVMVFNKMDLADNKLFGNTIESLKKQGVPNVVFTNANNQKCNGVAQLIQTVENLIKSSDRFNRSEENELNTMIIGVPNVGKSSLINALRTRYLKRPGSAKVGAVAGITRSVGEKIKVCEMPLIYVFDTPGILTPLIPDIETGMKLALCSIFKDDEIGIQYIADYLLYWMNLHNNFRYVEFLNLKEPSDNITEVLALSAVNLNLFSKRREFGGFGGYVYKPDLESAALNFVAAFRKGLFGNITLDCDKLV